MDILQPPLKIVQYPHPSLRHQARPLSQIDTKVRHAAAAMIELMYENKGVGLAAPQVGLPYRMFVSNYGGSPEQPDLQHVLINPVILERRGSQEGEEGCLSFPGLFRQIRRARTVKVQAYTLEGNLLEAEYSDFPARIWQHEIDHLDGILFIDKMGMVGKLSSRGALQELEQEYRRAQERGEIPPDDVIKQILTELEKRA